MIRRDIALRPLAVILTALALLTGTACAAEPPLVRRPNVVIIVADDMGYGDLSVYGDKQIPTPNIDSIAASGTRFTDGYVTCPLCAPSRAGMLSGRYQQRFGFETNPGPEQQASDKFGLPLAQTTLAERLKVAGYATGMFGKWHLGYREPFQPQNRGFDEFFGFLGGANRYYAGDRNADAVKLLRNGQAITEDQYLTEAFAREAAKFIAGHKDQPFFLYLPFNAVHQPLQATDKYRQRFPNITDPKRLTFAAMLSALDDGVGRVLTAIKEAGQEDDTLVFFYSDNGGPTAQTTASNTPLRGYKGQVLEGGIRVPFMVKWPGHVPAGQVYTQPVITLDIHTTVLAATGITIAPDPATDRPLDGIDLLPYLDGRVKVPPHDTLYWRLGRQWAVRRGDWKLVDLGAARAQEGVEVGPNASPRLYNLRSDIGESTDLAGQMPGKVAELRAAYDQWNALNITPLWKSGQNQNRGTPTPVSAAGKRPQDRRADGLLANFGRLDTDQDGFLSTAEYALAPSNAARKPFAEADTDKDGRLTPAEFAAAAPRGGSRKRTSS
jgi:arylsulfatase A-like enzyme